MAHIYETCFDVSLIHNADVSLECHLIHQNTHTIHTCVLYNVRPIWCIICI